MPPGGGGVVDRFGLRLFVLQGSVRQTYISQARPLPKLTRLLPYVRAKRRASWGILVAAVQE